VRLQLLILTLTALAVSTRILAQDPERPDSSAVKGTLGDPTSNTSRTVGPAILASITSRDKTANGSLGGTFGPIDRGEWNPWLKVSGPLDEDDATKPVTLADLSGMRSTAKVAAGLNFSLWPWKSTANAQRALCLRVFDDASEAPDSITKVIRDAVSSVPAKRQAAVRDSVLKYLVSKVCSRHRIPQSALREFDKRVDYGKIYLVGATVEYGRTTFKFADTVKAAFTKRTTEPWALSGGGGVYLPKMRMLLAGTLRYERGYEGGTPRQYCLPVGGTAALQCRSLALGAPEASAPLLLTAETRWFINEQTGISPHFTADLTGKKGVGFELPILVRQKTDRGFTSAVAIGWRSKQTTPDFDDRLYVSLTVGVTYGIGLKL
jgi:hypothetical protein